MTTPSASRLKATQVLYWLASAGAFLLLAYVARQYVSGSAPEPTAALPHASLAPQPQRPSSAPRSLPADGQAGEGGATTPVLPTPSTRPSVAPPGSEGYAPRVQRALEQGTASEALQAAQDISRCRDVDADVARVYAQRDAEKDPRRASGWLKTIDWLQAEQRKCQTLTPTLNAQKLPLLLKAAQGGAEGAAASYAAEQSPLEPVPATIVSALQRDAEAGHDLSLLALASTPTRWGLTDEDTKVYREAWRLTAARDPQRQQGIGQGLKQLLSGEPLSTSPRVQAIVEAQLRRKQQAPR